MMSQPSPTTRDPAKAMRPPARKYRGTTRIDHYEFLGKLGEGTFGEVYKARSKRTAALVALKKIIMHNEKDGFPITALREVKLLKLLHHINVLKLEDMAVEHPPAQSKAEKRKRPIMYMVTPYMHHDLSGLLDNPNVRFTIPQIKCYMLQLLQGLKYLHESKILHRDMKAANLLIDNHGILKIADFGLARHYKGPSPEPNRGGGEGVCDYTSLVVTRWYRAPELLLLLKRYTTAVDMWGVGCVFGEMLTRQPILTGQTDGHQLELIWDLMGTPTDTTMPGWQKLPGAAAITPRTRPGNLGNRFASHGVGAVQLLRDLLNLDWKQRINAIDALEHPYFRQLPQAAKPHELPKYEESHELDRKKYHNRTADPPPAPTGGAVGMGPSNGSGVAGYGYGPANQYASNGNNRINGHVPRRNGHTDDSGREPAWVRGENGLPPRPPPTLNDHHRVGRDPFRDHRYHRNGTNGRGRDGRPRRSGGGGGSRDVYMPSYDERGDAPPRRRQDDLDWDRDDRRVKRRERDWDRDWERDWDRDRHRERGSRGSDRASAVPSVRRPDYDNPRLNGNARSRSRSPPPSREWDRDRSDRSRDWYRR